MMYHNVHGNKNLKFITIHEFKNLNLLSGKKINKHYALVTNNFKYTKIKDIINWMSDINVLNSLYNNENKNLNILLNCIIYEFRENVDEWTKFNSVWGSVYDKNKKEFISNKLNPFTKEYYMSRQPMKDSKIIKLLINNPLEIVNKTILNGNHRACCMIGRLLNNKKYIKLCKK